MSWYCYHCGAELVGLGLPCEACQSWVAASWPKDALTPTDSMPPRPVWARLLHRRGGGWVEPPDEFEKVDAIRVLEDPANEHLAPSLWAEAFRIFDEAGR